MKSIVIVAAVALLGFLAWQNFPGLRNRISQAANEYGGWTEEARREDPVGFMQHAQSELRTDIEEFEMARKSLGETKLEAENDLEKFRDQEQSATALANAMRELFKAADANGEWPVTYLEQSYTREQLIDQVDELLAAKANAIARQADYQSIVERVALTSDDLRDRISDSRMALDELKAKETMVKVDKLSKETDELLAQVNELVEGNTRVAADPVRNVDELLQAAAEQAKAEATATEPSAAVDFLNS